MKKEQPPDLKARTKQFALRVIRLYAALPMETVAQVLGKRILRAGTSVGAHYREAQRAKSTADFVSKMEGGLQELEETEYWLELWGGSGVVPEKRLLALVNETEELISIFVSIVKKAKERAHPEVVGGVGNPPRLPWGCVRRARYQMRGHSSRQSPATFEIACEPNDPHGKRGGFPPTTSGCAAKER